MSSENPARLAKDQAVDWLVRQIRANAKKSQKRHLVSDAARHAHDLYETNVAGLPFEHLACGPGCGTCCCAHVGAEAAEAFALARWLTANRTAEELATLTERVRAVANQVADMDPGQRWQAQIPCAFLDDSGSCSVYPARPLACRGYTSLDRAACLKSTRTRDADSDIPGDEDRMLRALMLRHALAEATRQLLKADTPPDHQELHNAVLPILDGRSELAWIKAGGA